MKRLLCILCALLLLTAAALADTATIMNGEGSRNITIQPAGVNQAAEGVSPTTGRTLSELEITPGYAGLAVTGRYMPMLVQIDNTDAGIGVRAPWGLLWADVVYESALARTGAITRLSALFSDIIPDAVGPIRSARVGHVWIRQEWDCGFMYYGGQLKKGSNIQQEFSKLGAKMGVVLFNGTDSSGKPWKKFYTKRAGLISPHDKSGNAAAISSLIPANHKAAEHTLLFSDETPAGGTAATLISLDWKSDVYSSQLSYDLDTGLYYRYMGSSLSSDHCWVDKDTQAPIAFSNVIIEFVDQQWNGAVDAPVTNVVGSGNCELFRDGQHWAGVWERPDMNSRTVFYGPDGQEFPLQRGRTLIILFPRGYTATCQ